MRKTVVWMLLLALLVTAGLTGCSKDREKPAEERDEEQEEVREDEEEDEDEDEDGEEEEVADEAAYREAREADPVPLEAQLPGETFTGLSAPMEAYLSKTQIQMGEALEERDTETSVPCILRTPDLEAVLEQVLSAVDETMAEEDALALCLERLPACLEDCEQFRETEVVLHFRTEDGALIPDDAYEQAVHGPLVTLADGLILELLGGTDE